MKRIVAKQGRPVVIDVDPPTCGGGQVLVETIASTVSAGTEALVLARSAESGAIDIEYPGEPPYERPPIRHWMRCSPNPKPPLPGMFSLGYSLAGRVVEIGSDVPDLNVGDLVACAGSQDAHHAEFVAVSRNLVTTVPDSLNPKDAAFVTLGSVAAEAIRRTECRFGESVAIFGLGLLGLLSAQIARAAGLDVIAFEPAEQRRRKAIELGFEDVMDPKSPKALEIVERKTSRFGVDAAVLTLVTESSEPVNQAFRMTRRGGRVVGVGVYGINLERGVVFDRTYVHAIAFGAGRYDPWYEEGNVDYPIQYARWTENRTMTHFLRLLDDGAITVDGMTETFPLAEAAQGYERLSAPDRPYTIQFEY